MFATMFFACTYAACNGYVIDTANTDAQCYDNLVAHSDDFANVWEVKTSPDPLQKWLNEFKISETAEELTDYDFTCEFIKQDDIP